MPPLLSHSQAVRCLWPVQLSAMSTTLFLLICHLFKSSAPLLDLALSLYRLLTTANWILGLLLWEAVSSLEFGNLTITAF